ncbi:hypothetical protein caldi_10180 [Caldinitratiruptor microaerophilus]|uniref:SAF domain-containing protein n=1 Tax=Caldinitratiruptor microaerophilus TaxID=671077 RepID=A0AA35G811_9FIRM|nr:hypothetical protein caldi_10180 [Caldinitratiruptor microaerophilus]
MWGAHRGTALMLAGALVAGALAAVTALARLRALEAQLGEEVPAVVARVPLAAGEVIAPASLSTVGIARRYAFPSFYSDPAQVAGRVTRVPIAAGEPVLASMVARADGLALEQRVYTLVESERVFLEPDLAPGDRADVLVAYERGDNRLAEVYLQDALVVRVDTPPAPEAVAADLAGPRGTRISLRIRLEEARRLAWAENFGQQIRVVRRPAAAAGSAWTSGGTDGATESSGEEGGTDGR